MKIIDAHIHFRPEYEPFNLVAENAGHKNTLEHINKEYKRLNICHAVVMGNISPEKKDHSYPSNMSYMIGLDSTCFKDTDKPLDYFLYHIEDNLKEEKCVGLKLYPGYCPLYVTDEKYKPFLSLAKKYNKPVAIHTGALASGKVTYLKYSHPLTLDELAADNPDINFIMCHFGNPFLNDAAAVAEKNPNVSIDLSGLIEGDFDYNWYMDAKKGYIEILKAWLGYFGDYKRIMFGTDWPIVNIEKYISFIKEIIPEKYHEDVFFNNAVRIYNLKIK